MKHAEKHISILLVQIAIFLLFGNMTFANVTPSNKIKATEVSTVQADDDGKPFVFDELSIGKGSPTVSQNEYLGFGFVGIFYSSKDLSNAHASPLFNCSYSSTDKRELIFQYLFPFHFFW